MGNQVFSRPNDKDLAKGLADSRKACRCIHDRRLITQSGGKMRKTFLLLSLSSIAAAGVLPSLPAKIALWRASQLCCLPSVDKRVYLLSLIWTGGVKYWEILEALRKFACVLRVLSREADTQTRRVVCLTWGLLILTVVLLIFTILMAIRD